MNNDLIKLIMKELFGSFYIKTVSHTKFNVHDVHGGSSLFYVDFHLPHIHVCYMSGGIYHMAESYSVSDALTCSKGNYLWTIFDISEPASFQKINRYIRGCLNA